MNYKPCVLCDVMLPLGTPATFSPQTAASYFVDKQNLFYLSLKPRISTYQLLEKTAFIMLHINIINAKCVCLSPTISQTAKPSYMKFDEEDLEPYISTINIANQSVKG